MRWFKRGRRRERIRVPVGGLRDTLYGVLDEWAAREAERLIEKNGGDVEEAGLEALAQIYAMRHIPGALGFNILVARHLGVDEERIRHMADKGYDYALSYLTRARRLPRRDLYMVIASDLSYLAARRPDDLKEVKCDKEECEVSYLDAVSRIRETTYVPRSFLEELRRRGVAYQMDDDGRAWYGMITR